MLASDKPKAELPEEVDVVDVTDVVVDVVVDIVDVVVDVVVDIADVVDVVEAGDVVETKLV